jgi:hypothetical protein
MYSFDQLFSSSREFLEYFLWNEWFRTNSKFQANQTGKGGMIFRGQSDADWSLLSRAFRKNSLDRFTPQPPYEPMKDERRRYLGLHLHAEVRAAFIFLEEADAAGIATPIDYTTTRDGMALIAAALNDVASYDYSEPFPAKSFQRATALAQHHGVPTRFLDWTESPLVASYFAAFGASSIAGKKPEETQEIAVLFISTSSISRDDSLVEIIRAPRHENSFLRQQKGIFTNIRTANQIFLDSGEWPALETLSSNSFQIHRARLPASMADDLLRDLFDLGITRQSLMPNLNNAATAYSYAHSLFAGETKSDVRTVDRLAK